MPEKISSEELFKIIENIRFIIYGFFIGLVGIGALFGIIYKYLVSKIKQLDDLQDIKFRMEGIQSFAKTIQEMVSDISLLKAIVDKILGISWKNKSTTEEVIVDRRVSPCTVKQERRKNGTMERHKRL